MDVLDRDIELHRDERAHPRRVEDAGHADDPLARKSAQRYTAWHIASSGLATGTMIVFGE
jgi:hypothetical protein